MSESPALGLFRRVSRWPAGAWLFGRLIAFRAPYFGSIGARVTRLEPGACEAWIPDRRRVHNHIGTVHAIALCNLAELCAGLVTEVSIPRSMRWIPKGMTVEYLARAKGRMQARAVPAREPVVADAGYPLPVEVQVHDPAGQVVFRAEVQMWVSPRPRA